MKKVFIISTILLIGLYVVLSGLSSMQYTEGHYCMRLMNDFRSALQRYCEGNSGGVPVIYPDLTLTVEELLDSQYTDFDSTGYSDKLEDLRDGKDIYGNSYSLSIDKYYGDVILTGRSDSWFGSGQWESVARVNMGMVEILDKKQEILPIAEPLRTVEPDVWKNGYWKGIDEYKEISIPEPAARHNHHTEYQKIDHYLLNSEVNFYISQDGIVLECNDEMIFSYASDNYISISKWQQSPDGKYLCVIGTNYFSQPFGSQLVLFDLDKKTLICNSYLPDAKEFSSINFSQDSKQVYIAGQNGVFVYNAGTGNLDRKIGENWYFSLALSPDGKYLATGMALLGQIQVFDRETGNLVRCFRTGHKYLNNMTYSPDSKYLATWDGEMIDSQVKIWLIGN